MPFIAYWPGKIIPGQSDATVVMSAVDLFPTLCSIAGVDLPEDQSFDGVDMSIHFFSEKGWTQDRRVFWEYGRKNHKYSIPNDSLDRSPDLAVRDGEWKCLTSFDGETLELYNLSVDPRERNNVAADHIQLVQELKQAMLEWFEKTDKTDIKNK